jgi:glycosyltransferase involved in cell wall biosynthesis
LQKVLIIAHYYGTRVPGLVKYLPEFGFQPVLLTTVTPLDEPFPADADIVKTENRETMRFWKKLLGMKPGTDFRDQVKSKIGVTSRKSFIDRMLTLGGEITNYPGPYKGWQPFAVKAGDELLQSEEIAAMISSSHPVDSHIIARELKSRHGIPWVADLRDLWSQNHNYSYSRIRKMFDRRLEKKTLAGADSLVTVSPPWAEKLGILHKGKLIYTITNGFDPEKQADSQVEITSKFSITHTGNIYGGKQDPGKILQAVSGLIDEGTINPDDVEIRFYGPVLEWLDREIDESGLAAATRQYGVVAHDEAIRKQKESQLLLLLDWDSPGEKGVYPLKALEYLGAGRPILATGGETGNVVDDLLNKTGAGVHAITVEDVKSTLAEMYREYKHNGKITYHGLDNEINEYSQRKMAGKFADILDKLIL